MARIFRALLIAAVNTIKEFFAFATKECLERGLVNITNNGCTDLGDGLYQGGSGKSLEMSDILPITNANSWEFQTRYTYKSSASQCTLLGYVDPASNDYKTPWISIQSNRMYLRINNMSVWQSTFILEIDKTYDIKVGFTGTAYYIDAKLDTDENYTNYLTQSSTTKQNNTAPIMLMDLGYRTNTNQYYNNGIIDMTRTKFIIDGITTYFWTEILNVGDTAKLNDGMATSNYDWSAYYNVQGQFTKTGVIEQIKQVGSDTLYVTAEPEQDNKDATINTGKIYYAYTNGSNQSVYTTDSPIDGGTFNLENATEIGTLTNNNGVYSGFGTSNYLQSTFIPDLTKPFTFIMKFKQNSTRSYNWLFATTGSEYKGFACFINSSNKLFLSTGNSAGNGWQIDQAGVSTLSTGRDYWIKYTFDGTSTHKLYLSTTGEFNGEETTEFTKTNGSGIYSASALLLGHSYPWNSNQYLDGTIDMLNTSITIDNVTTDFGSFSNPSILYDDTFTALNPQPEFTIMQKGLQNATMYGSLTENNGVYSGFSSYNFLYINTSTPQTSMDFIIKCNPSTGFGDLLRTQPDGKGILLRCSSGSVLCYLSSTGSGWNVLGGFNTGISMTNNTDVYVRITWNSTNGVYTFWQSTDGETWTERNSSSSGLAAPYWSGGNQTIGGCTSYSEHWYGSVDMKETSLTIDGNKTIFYSTIDGIIINSDNYIKTSDNDLVQPIMATIETVDNTTINSVSIISDQTATIETSANITTSNNDTVITDGSYHLFNLTIPTGMTPIIESSGISYQTNEMPLLLKSNTGVGFLLKDGNNAYYHNTWIINRDYDLHFQEIRFATNVQDPAITLKINNVLTSAPYYTYAGDKIEYIISKEGYCDYSGSFITSYTSKDGKITTINVELVASNGTVDVSNYEYTLNNQGNMILTKYKGGTDTVVPNI